MFGTITSAPNNGNILIYGFALSFIIIILEIVDDLIKKKHGASLFQRRAGGEHGVRNSSFLVWNRRRPRIRPGTVSTHRS
jgi:hypothetical protein